MRMRPFRNGAGSHDPDALSGIAAGVAAGLAATAVMTLFQTGVSRVRESVEDEEANGAESDEGGESEESSEREESGEGEESGATDEGAEDETDDRPATVKAASAVFRKVRGRELPEESESRAGNLVHYGFGAAAGGVYGVLAEYAPVVTAGQGLAYGAGLMLLADEVAVPAAGLSEPPQRQPASTHVYALASHLVYGATCEAVRRGIRGLMNRR